MKLHQYYNLLLRNALTLIYLVSFLLKFQLKSSLTIYGNPFLKKACTQNHDLYFLKYEFTSYETHFIVRVKIIFITQ